MADLGRPFSGHVHPVLAWINAYDLAGVHGIGHIECDGTISASYVEYLCTCHQIRLELGNAFVQRAITRRL
jgi:hypothetical protein